MDLAVKWQELMDNPFFRNIPYKVELNKYGTILMSPASNWHGILQFNVGSEIKARKKSGVIIVECSILTGEGVRVADVAWASDEFFAEFGDKTPYPKAPEICVEIKSPANSCAEMEEKPVFIWKRVRTKFGLWTNKAKLISFRTQEKFATQKSPQTSNYNVGNRPTQKRQKSRTPCAHAANLSRRGTFSARCYGFGNRRRLLSRSQQ